MKQIPAVFLSCGVFISKLQLLLVSRRSLSQFQSLKLRGSKFLNYAKYTRPALFTILKPRDLEISKLYVVQERRATDFEAPNL